MQQARPVWLCATLTLLGCGLTHDVDGLSSDYQAGSGGSPTGSGGASTTNTSSTGSGCVPATCADMGGACGSDLDDGCNGTLACVCIGEASCGGGGVQGMCGCPTQQTLTGTIVDGDNGTGLVTWTQLQSATSCDSAGARAALDGNEGQGTKRLDVVGYGFSIPTGATVTSVNGTIRRQKIGGNMVQDLQVTLLYNGTVYGGDLSKPDVWPSSAWGDANYAWGAPSGIGPDIVNHPTFGVGVRANKVNQALVDAFVDCISLTVAYGCSLESVEP